MIQKKANSRVMIAMAITAAVLLGCLAILAELRVVLPGPYTGWLVGTMSTASLFFALSAVLQIFNHCKQRNTRTEVSNA